MAAPYSPAAIANEFFERAAAERKRLTPMQLLKLVYIAHGWHMAVNDPGRVLFEELVQAWQFGPVVPSLFHEFKQFGAEEITRPAYVVADREEISLDNDGNESFDLVAPFVDRDDEQTRKLLKWVWRKYGKKTGLELSDLTHMTNSPWSQKYDPNKKGIIIPNDIIRQYYVELWEKANGRQEH